MGHCFRDQPALDCGHARLTFGNPGLEPGLSADAGAWSRFDARKTQTKVALMGRGILLWLLGIPLPIIILLAIFWH